MKSAWNKAKCFSGSRDRLLFGGRTKIPVESAERLFFRFRATPVDGLVPISDIRYPDSNGTSCNRSGGNENLISHPQDVLFPRYYSEGVWAVSASLFERGFKSRGGVAIQVVVQHDPTIVGNTQFENYAHTLLLNYNKCCRTSGPRKGVPNSVKTEVRALLSEAGSVLKIPA